MLALPTSGISRSVGTHNVELPVLADWIEGCALFDEQQVSNSQVVDVLCEGEIYDDQAFAWEIVSDVWSVLKRRHSWSGNGSPFDITSGHVRRRVKDWKAVPAYSFCLLLTFAELYPPWANRFGRDYNEQGTLFERLTCESLAGIFPDWKIHPTGWNKTKTNKLHAVVNDVASRLGETVGSIGQWTSKSANEAGLDVLCHRPFPDGRVGVPVYLLQCASGRNWREKLHTPELGIWTRIITFAAQPRKAFAVPFALADEEFCRNCALVEGMLLDRYRLLSAGRAKSDWVSGDLKKALIKWAKLRVAALPRDE